MFIYNTSFCLFIAVRIHEFIDVMKKAYNPLPRINNSMLASLNESPYTTLTISLFNNTRPKLDGIPIKARYFIVTLHNSFILLIFNLYCFTITGNVALIITPGKKAIIISKIV